MRTAQRLSTATLIVIAVLWLAALQTALGIPLDPHIYLSGALVFCGLALFF